MNNHIFNTLGGNQNPQMNMIRQFQQFKQQMQGVNPQEEVNKFLQSGRINQAQLNQAQQMARQLSSVFGNIK